MTCYYSIPARALLITFTVCESPAAAWWACPCPPWTWWARTWAWWRWWRWPLPRAAGARPRSSTACGGPWWRRRSECTSCRSASICKESGILSLLHSERHNFENCHKHAIVLHVQTSQLSLTLRWRPLYFRLEVPSVSFFWTASDTRRRRRERGAGLAPQTGRQCSRPTAAKDVQWMIMFCLCDSTFVRID